LKLSNSLTFKPQIFKRKTNLTYIILMSIKRSFQNLGQKVAQSDLFDITSPKVGEDNLSVHTESHRSALYGDIQQVPSNDS